MVVSGMLTEKQTIQDLSFSILMSSHHTSQLSAWKKQGQVKKSITDASKSIQITPVGSSINGAKKGLKREEGKK